MLTNFTNFFTGEMMLTAGVVKHQNSQQPNPSLTEILDVARECDRVADLDPVGPRVAAEVRLRRCGCCRVVGLAPAVVAARPLV